MGKQSKEKDLTKGSPYRIILGFAIPMLLGFLFQNFYNMVDTIIVGKCLGVNALAGVGSTGSINFMINGFCIGVSSGFCIPIAQKFGAGDYRNLRKFTYHALVLTGIFAVVMTTVVALLCMKILRIMNTPEEIIDFAFHYIFIIFLGIPVTYFYNLFAGIIRSLGDSRTPVYFLLLSSGLNIVLDFFTILVLGMDVAGPALATVFSQGLSAVLCAFYMQKHYPVLKMQPDERTIEGSKMVALCAQGVPMGLQYSITAIGSVVLQTAVNSLGAVSVAGVTTGGKVVMFLACPFDALGGTSATFVGQNVGAGKLDRVRNGVHAASVIGFLYSIAAAVFLYFCGEKVATLFVSNEETQVISCIATYAFYNSLFFIPLVVVNVFRFAIQGMGFGVLALLAGVMEMIARALVGAVFVPRFGFTAACFASPLAWILADAFLIPAFYNRHRKLDFSMRKNFSQK